MKNSQYKHKTDKRHKKRNVTERFWEKVEIKEANECWEWKAGLRQGFGYGQFSFNGYPEFSHRVAWQLTNGDIPAGKLICHKCDNPLCVNPSHLFCGDQAMNIKDMASKSRDAFTGERNHSAKLNEENVRITRELYKNGSKISDIGNLFGVAGRTIADAVEHKTWKHIE